MANGDGMTPEEVLRVREAHHGDSYLEANEMLAVVRGLWNRPVAVGVFFCLSTIIMKVCRAFNDPEHLDNWTDIAGYALLAKDHLERRGSGLPSK